MRLRIGAALATVYVVWGSTYLGIRLAIDDLPPLTMLAVRFLIAGVLLYAWTRRRAAAPTAAQWRAAAISGIGLLAVGTGAVAWSELHLDTGVAALIVALVPLWLVALEPKRVSRRALGGVALGFAGVALLVGPGSAAFAPATLVLLVGTIGWAWSSVYASTAPLPENGLGAAMQMLCGGAALLVAGGVRGEFAHVHAPSWGSAAALAYLVVFGSLIAFTAYTWLLRNVRTSLVGTYAFVNPIVAVLLGALVLGEPLALRTLASGTVIVAGVALIVSAPRRSYPAPREVVRPALGQAPVR